MAKFSKSPFLPKPRGKTGGTMFSKNKYGEFLGMTPVPIKGYSDAQQKVRHSLGGLSQIWSYNLSDEQYAGWTKYARKFKRTDTSGNSYNLAPRDVFTNHNSFLEQVGMPVILDPPKTSVVQKISNFKFEIFAGDGEDDILLNFKPALNKDTRLLIFATNKLRNSKFHFKDTWFRRIGFVDNSFKSGDSIMSIYRDRFYYLFPPNFKIAFRVRIVNSATGFASDIIETSASFRTNL